MSKGEAITLIAMAVMNIAIVVTRALGFGTVTTILEEIAPEVNTVLVGVLALFGVRRALQIR